MKIKPSTTIFYSIGLIILVIAGFITLTQAISTSAQDEFKGDWTAKVKYGELDKIHFTLYRDSEKSNFTMSSSDYKLSDFRGLTREQIFSNGSDVKFDIAREAGTITCSGLFKTGRGVGDWTFTPNQKICF